MKNKQRLFTTRLGRTMLLLVAAVSVVSVGTPGTAQAGLADLVAPHLSPGARRALSVVTRLSAVSHLVDVIQGIQFWQSMFSQPGQCHTRQVAPKVIECFKILKGLKQVCEVRQADSIHVVRAAKRWGDFINSFPEQVIRNGESCIQGVDGNFFVCMRNVKAELTRIQALRPVTYATLGAEAVNGCSR